MTRYNSDRAGVGTWPVFVGPKADALKFSEKLATAGLGEGTRVLPCHGITTYQVLVTRGTLKQRDKILAMGWGN